MTKQQKLSTKQIAELSAFMTHKERAGAEVRRAAAVLYIDDEADEATLTRFTHYSRRQAFAIRKAYLETGSEALRDKRQSNRERVLTKQERDEVVLLLKTKQPKAVLAGCQDSHWSTGLLGEYIERHYGKRYKSKTSHYLLFKEAKLSFHLPGRRYEKADQAAQNAWVAKQTDGRSKLMRAWKDTDTIVRYCQH